MELREEVEGYLRRTGMSATRFGRLVARDPSLVSDLRRGRSPHGRLRRRILAQIGAPEDMGKQFASALAEKAERAGFALADEVEVSPWASSGFVGEQAVCRLRARPGADRRWPDGLADLEWKLPFLVADLEVSRAGSGVRVTALMLPGF